MPTILCITEKPSVAQDIAKILGATTRREGYFEGGNYKITWTFGHLCELKEPHDYSEMWKRWSLGQLPMIPERFSIKLKNDKGIEKQFNTIKALVGEASEVINCGDAGQEGELIQRWVLQLAECKVPVRRLWISSLTDDAIRKGFSELKPAADFQNLYLAGLSRAAGDWLLGMNATRLYTLKYSRPGNVLSIGRVQTPTLALIVKRQLEIQSFVPEDYWELKTLYRGATFNAVKGRFSAEAEAAPILERIKALPLTVTSVTRKAGREAPPRLFDLTSLQVECNRRWGWTADRTLALIQSLYEKKVTTYPRVDTTYLPEDMYPKVPDILRNMTPYAAQTAPVLAAKIPKSKKVFDNSKVTDHHAIIPTGESPRMLAGDEKLMYHLIALRFIAAFYPDCEFSTTTVLAKVDDVEFKTTGKVITKPGWRELYKNDKTDDEKSDKDEDKILPDFTEGESGPHEPSLLKKQTQPPKPYTEGTLLRAMESAGKTVDDEELREAMKENGIGRPSTRAAIIETLFRRKYIQRERKNIVATQAGIDLIGLIKEELLKSAKLTGIWENKLRRIERGAYSPLDFMAELKQMISEIVIAVLADNSNRQIVIEEEKKAEPKAKKPRAPRLKSIEEIACPKCGQGHLLKGRTAYGCSRYNEGCDLRLSFDQYPADLTPAQLRSKLK
ncbi:MAG: DNA topoisomerase 3 [Bacteroides sp.]|nr:DNA topoisomerase 3 [Bacteroides sp.]MCM1380162.1 DNA topoisomerase 3 [Bacteroides sp.]MCM1446470.1 DNA topoisomerase 3 [Prevotella sp.]